MHALASASSPFSAAALQNALQWLAAVLYLFGLLTLALRRPRGLAPGAAELLPATVGFCAQLGALVLEARLLDRLPMGNLHESLAFLAFLLAGAYLVAAAWARHPAFGGLLLAAALAFLLLSFVLPSDPATATESIRNRWFVFHTLLSFLGVTALFAACMGSILYLIADLELKSKRPGRLLRFVPSLVGADRASLRLLEFGFPLLTLGVVTGLLWSREAGGWVPGPKELLALLAWGIYGVLLFVRLARGWHGRKAAILSVSGALAALGAILGIRL